MARLQKRRRAQVFPRVRVGKRLPVTATEGRTVVHVAVALTDAELALMRQRARTNARRVADEIGGYIHDALT